MSARVPVGLRPSRRAGTFLGAYGSAMNVIDLCAERRLRARRERALDLVERLPQWAFLLVLVGLCTVVHGWTRTTSTAWRVLAASPLALAAAALATAFVLHVCIEWASRRAPKTANRNERRTHERVHLGSEGSPGAA